MVTRSLLTALLLLVAVACGNDLPTQPTPVAAGGTSIEGEYTLTLTASASCLLPPEAKQRTYTATVTEPRAGDVIVSLSGAAFLQQLEPGFTGTRRGDQVRFSLGSGNRQWVAERIDGKEVFFSGTANVTFADGNASSAFDGQIWVSVASNIWDRVADCTATDHKIEFVRR